jgi:gamma-glutamyltranspeptidase / glutathione hydrolase
MKPAGAAAALALLAAALDAQEPTRAAPRIETMRPEIVGSHGIVAAGRNYTVEAGIRMLRAGGNAVDAGVASVFAASVVEISHFGFGG